MHLPVETAATRCYDPNTAVWCDDWLREGASGWGGGGVVQHIHSGTSAEAPLKFKHLYKLEIDPFLFLSNYLSLSLSLLISAATHLFTCFLLLPIFPPLPPLPLLLPFFSLLLRLCVGVRAERRGGGTERENAEKERRRYEA